MPAKKRRKPAKSVHRTLVLTSPPVRGPDVKLLQSGLNRKLRSSGFDFKLKLDGKLGARTLYAARLVGFMLGVRGQTVRNLKQGKIGKGVQRLVREQRKRTPLELQLANRRARQVAKQRARINSGAKKAVHWALAQVGTTESPPGSNLGPKVSFWQRAMQPSWAPGWFWCGAFSGYASKVYGGAPISGRVVYTPNTLADARAGANGFRKLVSSRSARLGDHALFNFSGGSEPQHTGIVIAVTPTSIKTVDGNTSSGPGGSEDNGGGVFVRTRPHSQVVGCARPAYS